MDTVVEKNLKLTGAEELLKVYNKSCRNRKNLFVMKQIASVIGLSVEKIEKL